jgi:putative transcriptional regulator
LTLSLKSLAEMAVTQPTLRLLVDTAMALTSDGPQSACESGLALEGVTDLFGGLALNDEMPVAMAMDALDRTLARIDALDRSDERAQMAAKAAGRGLSEILALPGPVRDAAFDALESQGWKFAGRGVRRLMLAPRGDGAQVELLRINPGAGTPRHDHEGDEYTLVLTGAFHDGHHRYGVGDISVAAKGLTHQPVAEAGEVCFALAVTYGDLRFQGAMGLVQRALRLH